MNLISSALLNRPDRAAVLRSSSPCNGSLDIRGASMRKATEVMRLKPRAQMKQVAEALRGLVLLASRRSPQPWRTVTSELGLPGLTVAHFRLPLWRPDIADTFDERALTMIRQASDYVARWLQALPFAFLVVGRADSELSHYRDERLAIRVKSSTRGRAGSADSQKRIVAIIHAPVRNPVQSGHRLRSKADTRMVIADSR
jgi:hypothetical protein